MKKSIFALLLVIAVLLSFCSCTNNSKKEIKATDDGNITSYGGSYLCDDRSIPSFKTKNDGTFLIMQLTDTHLFSADNKDDAKTLNGIAQAVSKYKPDLVVVTGDMIDGINSKKYYNKKAALQGIATVFENAKCYWAYVPGNNDGEYMGSNQDVLAFLSQYSFAIFAHSTGISGATQYVINIKSGKNTVHSLVFLDSMSKDKNGNYDFIPSDETNWLSSALATATTPVSVFMHMNTPEFTYASEKGEPYNEDFEFKDKIDNSIPKNKAFDNAVSASKRVSLVSIGHLHPKKSECAFYDGRYYLVAQPSGFEKSKKPAATLITINTKEKDYKRMYSFDVTDKFEK